MFDLQQQREELIEKVLFSQTVELLYGTQEQPGTAALVRESQESISKEICSKFKVIRPTKSLSTGSLQLLVAGGQKSFTVLRYFEDETELGDIYHVEGVLGKTADDFTLRLCGKN